MTKSQTHFRTHNIFANSSFSNFSPVPLDSLGALHDDLRSNQPKTDQRRSLKRYLSYIWWSFRGLLFWILWPIAAVMMAIKLGLHTSFVFGTVLRLGIDFLLFAALRVIIFLLEYKSRLRFYGVRTFEQWATVAAQLDVAEGKDVWRKDPVSPFYDYVGIERSLWQLKKALGKKNCKDLEFCLTGVVDRHYCGIDNPGLHTHCRLGTKQVIEEYLSSVEEALQFFCDHTCSVHTLQDKITFIEKAMYTQGKTAICFSGGGALAMIHTGVLQTLLQHNLLPNLLSGTSGGALVVAMIASRTDEELVELLTPDIVNKFKPFLPSLLSQIINFLKTGVALNEKTFCETMKNYIGTYTFAEAYQRTGRIVNISVTKSHTSGYPILLNYKNAPHVMLWSAVTASCALPGLLKPVHLYAKSTEQDTGDDATDFPLAYPSEFKFMDGSMMADLPLGPLRRLYGVNQFIISQVNPHVAPFVRRRDGTSTFFERLERQLVKNLKHRISRLCDMNLMPNMFGQDIRGVFLQQYSETTCDTTTIIPEYSPFTSMRFLTQPTREDMKHFMHLGNSATWAKLPQIFHRLRLEKTIEFCLQKLNKQKPREQFVDGPGNSLRRVTSF